MSRADKLYKNSPELQRDEESGKMAVTKTTREEPKAKETEGEALPVESRHAMDRLSLHHKHEGEHMAHKGGDKKEMHKRHLAEHEAMMKRHEKELGKK